MTPKLKRKYITKTIEQRLHHCPIPVVGLTGGIATGKSSVAKILRKKGHFVIDADQLIKKIYQKPEVISAIDALDLKFVEKNKIQFQRLREWAFESNENKGLLEGLLYPYLPSEFNNLVTEARTLQGVNTVIYEVPLLFEKNLSPLVDVSVCVYISGQLQLKRLAARDSTTSVETLKAILEQQWSIEKKAKASDYIINNAGDLKNLEQQVDIFIETFFE